MKIVGLTGGIGSGKSTVAKMFKELGISVYIADNEAKKLMNEDEIVKQKIIALLGTDSYVDNQLNRPYIASIVFNDSSKLTQLNAIVHPAVATHFDIWKNNQGGEYVIKEVAILFENEGHKQCDHTILVMAPIDERIKRVLKRDKTTKEEILSRINNQWDDTQKIPLADFVINNMDLEETKKQVCEIHKKISSQRGSNANLSFC
ncbi:dephospho-CoA kinase [Aquimarina mytili]|uniref:Dephospho-CoA kinase n=1 Tax=Aquimarina mytili TaxID=874423 RepID=A0A937D4T4_9FLAO|nr:dephospho-CoA kinase [Aquimarina mytili]MBL0682539.1 dephospho-CoA kinase [Aquimarina mytili]